MRSRPRGLLLLTGAAVRVGWRAAPLPLTLVVVLTVSTGVAPVVAAWLLKVLLDELVGGEGSAGRAAVLAVALAGIAAVTVVTSYVIGYQNSVVSRAVTAHVEDRLTGAVNRFVGLRYYEDPAFHDQMVLAEEAAQDAPQEVISFLIDTTRIAVTVAGFLGVLISVWPPMAVLLMVVAVPAVVAQRAFARRTVRISEAMSATHRRQLFYRELITDPRAAKEIRLFGLGALFQQRMLSALRRTQRAEQAVERRSAVVQSALAVLSAAVAGLGTTVVVVGAARGTVSVGEITLFLAAVATVQSSFAAVVLGFGQVSTQLQLFRHYLDVVGTPADLASGTAPVWPLRDRIELVDVWFRYHPDAPWVLRGVSLTLPYGRAVGLVGVNGAGKSTLVKLLCRFYDPEHGQILWDGVDIREIEVAQLRRRIGATFQDYMTYDLTAAENIGIGDVEHLHDLPRIRGAARLSESDERLAALPRGYDTLLSRTFVDTEEEGGGSTLSGGQWQRLALARSLMRCDADLLILDEPSSGLDPAAEERVHQTLHRHRAGHTSLLISHRLNALRAADDIVVLSEGAVVEHGTHDELMTLRGEYARLFTVQATGYQDRRVTADAR